MKREDITAANQAAWDASAPAHEASEGWGRLLKEATRPGFTRLDATLTAALGDLSGQRAVQVGCNNGQDLLSLASLGAQPALGIDQSEGFLSQARRLAQAMGSDCGFLKADIYDLPQDAPCGFDLCLITIGVLNWMPDLPRFFEIVAGLLAPGGRLVIYETHPFLEMVEPGADDPHALTHSYFKTDPFVEDQVLTYDGSDGGKGATSFWFLHKLGDVVTGVAQAGLRVERLQEFGHSNREVEYDIYEGQAAQMPMCYILEARA